MIDNYKLNKSEKYIQAKFEHLSIKAVFPISGSKEVIDPELSDIIIYPNPFQPYDNNNKTGRRYDGTPGSGVYFKGLNEYTQIKVFDERGKLVYENVSPAGIGYYQWNVCNYKGQELASGVYLILFNSNGKKRIVKFVVIR